MSRLSPAWSFLSGIDDQSYKTWLNNRVPAEPGWSQPKPPLFGWLAKGRSSNHRIQSWSISTWIHKIQSSSEGSEGQWNPVLHPRSPGFSQTIKWLLDGHKTLPCQSRGALKSQMKSRQRLQGCKSPSVCNSISCVHPPGDASSTCHHNWWIETKVATFSVEGFGALPLGNPDSAAAPSLFRGFAACCSPMSWMPPVRSISCTVVAAECPFAWYLYTYVHVYINIPNWNQWVLNIEWSSSDPRSGRKTPHLLEEIWATKKNDWLFRVYRGL